MMHCVIFFYVSDSAEPLEEREKFFQAHEFLCSCRLCKFQRKTEGVQVRKERGRILREIEMLDDKDSNKVPHAYLFKS